MNTITWLLVGIGGLWLVNEVREFSERRWFWQRSVEHCNRVGKKLLRIGMRRSPFEPPNGDVTLDLDRSVLSVPGGVLGDVRDMPFADGEFGVCFNEHVIEHLASRDDVEAAIQECARVADYAVVLCPSPWSFGGLFHPDHKLRVWLDGKTIVVEHKPYVKGWRNVDWPTSFSREPRIGDFVEYNRDRVPKVIEI